MGDLVTYPPAYERVNFRGYTLDQMTRHAILDVEKRLGIRLDIYQGSYNAGRVEASAGTHDGGGAVDVNAHSGGKSSTQIVNAMRAVGFAAWHRAPISGIWGEHVHAILIGNEKVSASAARQIVDYKNHRDGLASHAADNTWHPDPIRAYVYPPQFTRGPEVDHAIGDVKAAKVKAADKPARLSKLRAALEALRSIKPRRK